MNRLDSQPIRWIPRARVDKYEQSAVEWVERQSGILAPDANTIEAYGVRPYESIEVDGNLLTTAGLTRLTNLLTAGGGQALTNTSTRLGVGNGAGTAAVGDTDLSAVAGAANRWFQVMDATFPSASAAVVTFKSTFATGDGNFAWNEWGLDIGTPPVTSAATVNAVLFNHKTSAALGTKASGSWALTVTVTFS